MVTFRTRLDQNHRARVHSLCQLRLDLASLNIHHPNIPHHHALLPGLGSEIIKVLVPLGKTLEVLLLALRVG